MYEPELILPITENESLKALQAYLKDELKEYFRRTNTEQSENCYISFQIYNFPQQTVKYLSVDSYQFYEESFDELVNVVKHVVPNQAPNIGDVGNVIRNVIEKIVLCSNNVSEISANWEDSIEAEFNSIKSEFKEERINSALSENLRYFNCRLEEIRQEIITICSSDEHVPWSQAKSFYFVDLLHKVLRSILEGLEQSLSVGLASKVYSGSSQHPGKIIKYTDISKVQRQQFESKLDTPSSHQWNYLFITNIERFFFVGGFKRNSRSSFVLFAPLYMYGQRLGYMFVIESYSKNYERRKKMRVAKKFLEQHKEHEAIFLKELKERRFLADVVTDLRKSKEYSDESFFNSLKSHLPSIVNVLGVVDWNSLSNLTDRNVLTIAIHPNETNDIYVIEIPIRIRENGGGSSTEQGLLYGEVNEFEGQTLQQKENLHGLTRAFSTAAELFLLNRQIQRVAKDAEWKIIFDRLFHSQKQFLEALQMLCASFDEASRSKALYLIDMLVGFLEVSKYSLSLSDHISSKFERRDVSLSDELNKLINVLYTFQTNEKVFKRVFKIKTNAGFISRIYKCKQNSLFIGNYSSVQNDSVNLPVEPAILLFKELLINAVENADENDPIVRIDIYPNRDSVCVNISNNLEATNLESMKNPFSTEGKYGFQIIHLLKEALGWSLQIDSMNGQTIISVLIPKGN